MLFSDRYRMPDGCTLACLTDPGCFPFGQQPIGCLIHHFKLGNEGTGWDKELLAVNFFKACSNRCSSEIQWGSTRKYSGAIALRCSAHLSTA